jgi:putative glutamine amidotransferase
MEIYAVTDDFHYAFSSLFKELGTVKILPEDKSEWKNISADLIVFPGGEDISPSRYGATPTFSRGVSKYRDEIEFRAIKSIKAGTLKTKKVLGVCRGLQLLNVSFGGVLCQDIFHRYGSFPQPIHALNYVWDFALCSENFPIVNSLHHQCVEYIGDHVPYRIIATDSKIGTYEIILWEDKFLGVQFHPEFMPTNSPGVQVFVDLIHAWVDGMGLQRKNSQWSKQRFGIGESSHKKKSEISRKQNQEPVINVDSANTSTFSGVYGRRAVYPNNIEEV